MRNFIQRFLESFVFTNRSILWHIILQLVNKIFDAWLHSLSSRGEGYGEEPAAAVQLKQVGKKTNSTETPGTDMKAPAFDYIKPHTCDEVFALLAEYGDEARLLAGGQTLLATLNMRLSEPALLIDINDIDELKGIALQGDELRINALARHSEIESSPLVAQHAPLLAMAAPHIAHRAIRNRGTFGGSIAYADPAAEWPACALALDATIIVRGMSGERRIAAADFFLDLFTTALADGEMLVACEIPIARPGAARVVHAFDELARRHGDYAIVGVAAVAQRDQRDDKQLRQTRLAFLGIGSTPMRARQTEQFLDGKTPTPAVLDQATDVLRAELDGKLTPLADLTNSPATKRHLATVLLRRAVASLAA
jgi:carbon-monoxide dehydrogenase medium subunit